MLKTLKKRLKVKNLFNVWFQQFSNHLKLSFSQTFFLSLFSFTPLPPISVSAPTNTPHDFLEWQDE
jgi:hypothetical protein